MNLLQRLTMLFVLVALVSLSFITPAQAGGVPYLTMGDVVYETLYSSHGDEWTFRGSAGQWVDITMSSFAIDTYLELYDPYGNQIAWNDDDSGTDSRIFYASLPYSGNYTIVARSFDGGRGDYALSLDGRSPMPTPRPCGTDGWQIAYGDSVSGETWCRSGTQWTFHGDAGIWIEINMISYDMDTYLELYDPYGNQIAWNDDDSGSDSRIYYHSLPYNGTYTIVAKGYDGDTGSYYLTLE